MNRQILESLWVLIGAVIFASCNAVTKLAALDGFHFWEILLFRSIASLVVLSILMAIQGAGFKTKHVTGYALRASAGSLGSLFSVLSVALLPIGMANTLCSTAPLFMGLSFAFLAFYKRERQDWLVLSCLVVGFSGVAVILLPSGGNYELNVLGVLAGIGAAVLDTVAYWCINYLGRYNEPSQRLAFWYIAACVLLGLAGCLFYVGFTPLTMRFFVTISIAGALHVFGIVAMTRSWAKGYVPLVGTLQFSTVVFCVLIGFMYFGDHLGLRVLCGIAMVIFAGIFSTLARIRKK